MGKYCCGRKHLAGWQSAHHVVFVRCLQLAVVAPSGIGKTTLIAFTWLNGMVAPKVYNAQRKADLCPREELEATRLA